MHCSFFLAFLLAAVALAGADNGVQKRDEGIPMMGLANKLVSLGGSEDRSGEGYPTRGPRRGPLADEESSRGDSYQDHMHQKREEDYGFNAPPGYGVGGRKTAGEFGSQYPQSRFPSKDGVRERKGYMGGDDGGSGYMGGGSGSGSGFGGGR
ncbi:hypothetical protein PGT21_020074 [Puccinia graminis f. sp. tritici]|uniref:Uncharacterized protein n=2 Tax=Puccinia graminis f. sp. tritici TaxID=56615 RepID=E3KUR2_PUCGT|nr:uncharacterized protein PGTG_13816 [Puccinia graminis f. sp. tritici CRL 75-36-700-3]EFP88012.1 hypothetical protein PGTG_13816 [Puccinia graminis f. sp. tritici CRL 75-36-700-3]KAA1108646.1 hypothetical protein PGT21_020074 [Puccinia graminis f. sp. tritici]